MSVDELGDKVRRTAGIAGGLIALGSVLVQVDGRPVKEKEKPAKVRVFGLPVFERLESGKQYVLWFRIRDVRR